MVNIPKLIPLNQEEKNLKKSHFLVINENDSKKVIHLTKNSYSIGRASSCSIILNSRLVSRHHATLIRIKYPQTNQYLFWIIDGDLQGNRSTNNLFINNKRCFWHELKPGDKIGFGAGVTAQYLIEEHIKGDPANEDTIATENKIKSLNIIKKTEQLLEIEELEKTKIQEISKIVTSQFQSTQNQEELTPLPELLSELLPHPIIEINLEGEITYLNSIALYHFKDLENNPDHLILKGIIQEVEKQHKPLLVRHIRVNHKLYKQYIHYLEENQVIRSYIFDLSVREETEKALIQSEERYKAVVRQISEGIFLVDAQTKQILEANPAYTDLLGYDPTEILKLTLDDIIAWQYDVIEKDLDLLSISNPDLMGESIHRCKDNSLIDVEVNISLIHYDTQKIFCFAVRNITERKQSEELLHYQAFHDLLTGLPNRTLFQQRLNTAINNAKINQNELAIIFLDLDRFKTINDTLGHGIGDKLLENVAERLLKCVRDEDTVARWGGDEFTILLPHIQSKEQTLKIAQRILHAMTPIFEIEENEFHISCSMGISIFPMDGQDGKILLRNADVALYRAKDQGRNNYQCYLPIMNDQSSDILTLENRLHSALQRNEFYLYYQPQINTKTQKISGIEALLRWHDPTSNQLIPPAKFIPIAEETGLIIPIGEWVLRTACLQNKAWQDAGFTPVRVAVNLSPRQFQQKNIVSLVTNILTETGLDPHWLELEITENTLMQNMDFAQKALTELSQMGVHLSMDDFGTGYSSLGYLKKFPFDTLKIDQSFIRDLQQQPKDIAIISAVIALGKGFNLRILAEGVETENQLNLLNNLHCEEMQGYWFAKPLSVENITALFQENLTNFFKKES